ncbi:DNA adenine methylase [soil metagenome]
MDDKNSKIDNSDAVLPFLKWPGGKRWTSNHISKIIEKNLHGCYYEPFLGGGTVFFNLLPKNAYLSDLIYELINTYKLVKESSDEIIKKLKLIPVSKEMYYQIRRSKPESRLDRAIRFLYLNRTGFGGMYRVNSKGEFNVPYGGGQRKPDILWKSELLKCASKNLKNVTLKCVDFEKVIDLAKRGDVVYCDPTYTVAHSNNGFVKYNEKIFSWEDQERLFESAVRAYDRGVTVLISNASHESIFSLYKLFKPQKLKRMSLMSRKIDARKKVESKLLLMVFIFDK